MSATRLSPFPSSRDAVVEADRRPTVWWSEWFLNLYTVVKELTTGRAHLALDTTASAPDAVTDRLLIYSDGTDLKVKFPDGTVRTVTLT